MLLITLSLIIGIVHRRPVYMLPFFCYQVFDFIISCLTAIGHYHWLPHLQHQLERQVGIL